MEYKAMLRYFLIVTLFLFWAEFTSAQTFLVGTVKDGQTGMPLEFVTISVFSGETFINGTVTDELGKYRLPIDPGTYDLNVSNIEFTSIEIKGVDVYKDKFNEQNIVFDQKGHDLDPITVRPEEPIIKTGDTEGGRKIKGKELVEMPSRDIGAAIAGQPGVSQLDEGQPIYFAGVRSSGTVYYIDDVRVEGSGSLVPISEIEELSVITSGFSAQYGDVIGGIVSITTKGMTNKWGGGLELESSQFLDAYGQNLVNAYASGPLLKSKTGRPILGARLGVQWNKKIDDAPTAVDIPYLTDEAFERFSNNPVVLNGTSVESAAAFITEDDISFSPFQKGETYERLDLSGKITARISPFIDLSLGGAFVNIKDQFTPLNINGTNASWRLLNYQNNPINLTNRFRTNFKFRHRIGDSWTELDSEQKRKGMSFLQYNIIGGFEKRMNQQEDTRHENRFFDYGHIGKFDFEFVPTFNEEGTRQTDYLEQFSGYTPGASNPLLANYNTFANLEDYNSFSIINGETRSGLENVWGLHSNINQVYNRYNIRNNDRINFSTNVSFDYRPNENGGIHAIKLGLQYEQRVDRGYQINPEGLWQVARALANNHFSSIDTLQVVGTQNVNGNLVDIHPITYNDQPTNAFYQNIRALTGFTLDDYINIDGLSPDQLSLDLFSPDELNSGGNNVDLNYWGYDYTGKISKSNTTFEDFFREKDEQGIRTLPVAAWQPSYLGVYFQDKFSYKDILFNIGLRIDRYDANSKVLKDPYSLYPIMTATDYYREEGTEVPEGIHPLAKVYTKCSDCESVQGYRLGDQWYNAEGEPLNSGAQLFGGEVVTPKFYSNNINNIQSDEFETSGSFEDYTPEWNFLPRVSFSFPISKTANFFAHYDILSQRPEALGINVSRVSALDYYNFNRAQPLANANLKTQQTIEYQLGYQQAVGKNAAIKLTTFYKELRNLIQQRTYLYLPSPITSYTTYSNIDFGTVKGFSFSFFTKRIRNVKLNTSYSLLFSDGTGSNVNSQRGLTSTGNIRTLYPLDYDERHQLQASLDFRYEQGKKYNGPVIWGKNILENAGLNIQATAISGRPYTGKALPTVLNGNGTIGQVNGLRLPWQNVVHLKLNKYISLTKEKNGLGMNVYLRIQNLFNKDNIVQVFPATGSPSDDGFLNSPEGQNGINSLSEQADRQTGYLNAYNWRLINPNFFTLGRRIYLGATFSF